MQNTEIPIPVGTKVNYFNVRYKTLVPCTVVGSHASNGRLVYTLRRVEPTAEGRKVYTDIRKKFIRRYKDRP